MKSVECVDCVAEAVAVWRPVKRPGPRCATHARQWKKASSEQAWERYILATYSITAGQYWTLYAQQGGACAVCGWANGKTRRLSVDHDHACCSGPTSCGRCVRGLLCRPCNTLLGRMGDSVATFERAIVYLKRRQDAQR